MTAPRLGSAAPSLEIDALTVRFGGLVAVDNLSLTARAGMITGLIGPNGAGKSTTFNRAAGTVRASTGSVRLGGDLLNHRSPAQRAQRGLGRTFQRMELFDSMTVAENVALGPELLFAGRRVWRHLGGGASERDDIRTRSLDAIDRCGLAPLATGFVSDLSTGERRLVELARALATPFTFLLLDEPSSGLDANETVQFGSILREAVERLGIGILLVEHDMALIRSVCTYAYVLDFGRLIFDGPTSAVLVEPVVKAAYLGSEAVEALAVT